MDPSADGQWRNDVDQSISRLESGMQEILDYLRNQAAPAAPPVIAAAPTSATESPASLEPRLSPPEAFKGILINAEPS